MDRVGESVAEVDAATWAIGAVERVIASFDRSARSGRPAGPALRPGQEDALLQLCAAPLTTVSELARLNRAPATTLLGRLQSRNRLTRHSREGGNPNPGILSLVAQNDRQQLRLCNRPATLRGRLDRLAELGLADSVSHHLGALGPKPQRRYFPTKKGIHAASALEPGIRSSLADHPVSRQWFRILAERLDAVAVLYHVAALIADADPEGGPLRVDHYRQGPYDLLVTLSQGRSVGILRQGATLPSAHLRYRLRTIENLPWSQRPSVTLVITGSGQATRRAVRTLGHPVEHQTFFVATEGEQLAGDHQAVAWQQCGHGMGAEVKIEPCFSLENIVSSIGWLVDRDARDRRDNIPPSKRQPTPNPYSLYPTHRRAAMPDPAEQIKNSLAVQLTRAGKEALDLLAAWPLCTTDQLAGLMGGVTRRRANQVLRSLTSLSLVHSESQCHVLRDEGLRYLAHWNRSAVRIALGRWSARWHCRRGKAPVYAGTALRSLDSQLDHQYAINTVVAALSAEAAHSRDHHLLELLPTSRSSIGYHYQGADYVIHPDATFWLAYQGDWRPYFLEFERRAVTPRRVPARLRNYRRYFASGWAGLYHAGQLPLVLFVFETHDAEESFLRAAGEHRLPICTSNLEMIHDSGVLGEAWRWPPPNAPDRLLLHRLGDGYMNVPSRSRRFL